MKIQFQCSNCKDIFEKDVLDEIAALEEYQKDFGGDPNTQPSAKVCDDCYAKIMKWWKNEKS